MAKRQKAYEYKTINSRGAHMSLFRELGSESWKLHSWDGPAIKIHDKNHIDSTFSKNEYHLYGRFLEKEQWQELKSQREGIPFYKNPSMKHLISDYRN